MSGYSGDAGDALSAVSWYLVSNGMKFSTLDQDNDNLAAQCAGTDGIMGWWYNKCTRSVLNTENNAVWNANSLLIKDVEFARMMVKLG